ncbi:MAG: isoprenylcysteine carboxylmethyltransferase family protein [Acidobacteriota bacterium]
MDAGFAIAAAALAAAGALMAGEAVLSAHNERQLRARGAVEPAGDVYAAMRWAYPACFAAMAAEGAVVGPAPETALAAGLIGFALAKSLKLTAISALGARWSFRVLVVPGAPLVTRGPYRVFRHPNYIAVAGEIVSFALIVAAPVTGPLGLLGFGWLMRRRIAVEDRALGREP